MIQLKRYRVVLEKFGEVNACEHTRDWSTSTNHDNMRRFTFS